MKIIEQFIEGKTGTLSACEDAIFVSDDFAAVIDGATSKSARKYNNEFPGRACAQLIINALEDLPRKSSSGQAVAYLSGAILSLYKRLKLVSHLARLPLGRASACIAIYSKYRNEIWMVGDCQCLVDKTRYTNRKTIDDLLANVRSLYIQAELAAGRSYSAIQASDPGRKYILPLLKRQMCFQNSTQKSDFVYGVLDGFMVPEQEIRVIKLSSPRTIVLASDGYPKVFASLARSESYLAKVLKKDPLCYLEYKSTKGLKKGDSSFDDRAYLKIRV